jgi:hypothetical protein
LTIIKGILVNLNVDLSNFDKAVLIYFCAEKVFSEHIFVILFIIVELSSKANMLLTAGELEFRQGLLIIFFSYKEANLANIQEASRFYRLPLVP